MTFARLTAVYGLQPSEIWEFMPLAMVEAYLERIPAILAMRRLEAGSAASLPYLEEPAKVMEKWSEEAYDEPYEPPAATPGMLKLMGIGVEHVAKSR